MFKILLRASFLKDLSIEFCPYMKRWILFVLILQVALSFRAQDCSSADANQLCAEATPLEDSLINVPLNLGCMNVNMTYYATFQTGSSAGGNAQFSVTPGDCDDFTGPNTFTIAVYSVNPAGDYCNTASYTGIGPCNSSAAAFTHQVNNLEANTTYLVILGSDHLPNYGPCEFSMEIAGSAVDLSTSVSPFLIFLGGTSEITAFNANNVTWSPDTYLNQSTGNTVESTPEISTTYNATGEVGGCVVTGQATVTVGPPLIIYEGITPNGDGVNDTWIISGIQRFDASVVTVYDRWGQRVFRSTGYAQPWDGTNKGNALPMGAYFYVIELNSFEVEIPPITGVISILK